jgi:hypothetical protein
MAFLVIQAGGEELLNMDQYEYIRTAHRVYGKNISELARQTGHSRNTIKKALHGESWGYREREQQSFPVLGPYRSLIEAWLRADKEVPKKQRHTARRVYNRLCTEQGYQGSVINDNYSSHSTTIIFPDTPYHYYLFIPCWIIHRVTMSFFSIRPVGGSP